MPLRAVFRRQAHRRRTSRTRTAGADPAQHIQGRPRQKTAFLRSQRVVIQLLSVIMPAEQRYSTYWFASKRADATYRQAVLGRGARHSVAFMGRDRTMRDPELVARAGYAAARLEQAWERWRALHGLAGSSDPLASYVGYSLKEPMGQPRVVIGVDAAEAECFADFLESHDIASAWRRRNRGRSTAWLSCQSTGARQHPGTYRPSQWSACRTARIGRAGRDAQRGTCGDDRRGTIAGPVTRVFQQAPVAQGRPQDSPIPLSPSSRDGRRGNCRDRRRSSLPPGRRPNRPPTRAMDRPRSAR